METIRMTPLQPRLEEREEKKSDWDLVGGDSEEKGNHIDRNPTVGSEQSQTHTGCNEWNTKPLLWLESWWDPQEGCGKARLHLWGACECLLAPKAVWREWVEGEKAQVADISHSRSSACTPTWADRRLQHHLSHVTATQRSDRRLPQPGTKTRNVIRRWGSSSPKCHLNREGVAVIGDCIGGAQSQRRPVTESRPPQPVPQSSLNAYTYPSRSALFLSEARCGGAREGKSTHLKGSQPVQSQASGLLLSSCGGHCPPKASGSHWAEGKPGLTPDSSPSFFNLTSTSTSWRQAWLLITSNPVLPSKPIG